MTAFGGMPKRKPDACQPRPLQVRPLQGTSLRRQKDARAFQRRVFASYIDQLAVDQNLRSAGGLILTHTQLQSPGCEFGLCPRMLREGVPIEFHRGQWSLFLRDAKAIGWCEQSHGCRTTRPSMKGMWISLGTDILLVDECSTSKQDVFLCSGSSALRCCRRDAGHGSQSPCMGFSAGCGCRQIPWQEFNLQAQCRIQFCCRGVLKCVLQHRPLSPCSTCYYFSETIQSTRVTRALITPLLSLIPCARSRSLECQCIRDLRQLRLPAAFRSLRDEQSNTVQTCLDEAR